MDDPTDCTTDPVWQLEQTDRLIAWEYLQAVLGRGSEEMTERHLAEKIAVPGSFWYDMIRKVRLKAQNARHTKF